MTYNYNKVISILLKWFKIYKLENYKYVRQSCKNQGGVGFVIGLKN